MDHILSNIYFHQTQLNEANYLHNSAYNYFGNFAAYPNIVGGHYASGFGKANFFSTFSNSWYMIGYRLLYANDISSITSFSN